MSDANRQPTRAEKSAAWLVCALAVAGFAWATGAAYSRTSALEGERRPLTFLETGCMLWVFLVGVVAVVVALIAIGFVLVRVISWTHWALTTGAEKPADAPFDDEADWR